MAKRSADLILGDCLNGLLDIHDEVVDLTVTSPPFGNIHKYAGNLLTDEVFRGVAHQLWRTTREGGVVCWQEGDQIVDGDYSGLSWRHAHYFQDIGFRIYESLITGSVGLRFPIPRHYRRPPIYVFVLAKGRPRTVNLLADRTNVTVGQRVRHNERMDDGRLYVRPKEYEVGPHGVRTTIWLYPTGNVTSTDRVIHPAPMHEALARDLILTYSEVGCLVCDPFAGVATTGKMCVLLGRNFLGWEVHPPYHERGVERLRRAIERSRWPYEQP
jgi:DNA modification methylase